MFLGKKKSVDSSTRIQKKEAKMPKNTKMIFCNEGLILDTEGRYFQPSGTENIEGFVELDIPESPEVQFYGPKSGFGKIYVGPVNVMSLFDLNIQVKPYEKLSDFELRVLSLAIKKGLKVDFDRARQVLSLQYIDNSFVNSNVQSSIAPKKVVKEITGGSIKVPIGSACLENKN